MNETGFKEELVYLIAAKNHLWIGGLSSFGGSMGLILFPIPLVTKGIMMSIGFVISALFIDNYFRKDDRIEKIIKFLKKKGV